MLSHTTSGLLLAKRFLKLDLPPYTESWASCSRAVADSKRGCEILKGELTERRQ